MSERVHTGSMESSGALGTVPCPRGSLFRWFREIAAALGISRVPPTARYPRSAVALTVTLAILALSSTSLRAQDLFNPGGRGNGTRGSPPVLVAVPLRGDAPTIDGRLEEEVWKSAVVATGFRQFQPHPGAPASQRTEARLLYGPRALYVGIRAFDTAPDSIFGQVTRRDEDSYSDWVGIMIDSYYDRRTAFQFSVNPAGVKMDQRWHDDTEEDKTWDPVWDVAASRDNGGWTAEMAIPYSQLRFRDASSLRWGVNFHRNLARKDEISLWAPILPEEGAVVSRFGALEGLREIHPPGNAELLPYVLSRSQDRSPREAGKGGGQDRASSLGADVKLRVSPELTLDLTFNPDYGQVEADPSRVNLTAFETFFPERRPFFLESAHLFDLRISLSEDEEETETLFYSRRVGGQPHGAQEGGTRSSPPPGQTTILGAAKLSGRTAGGWSVGVLSAVTQEERASGTTEAETGPDDSGAGSLAGDPAPPREMVVEPMTSYSVAHLQRDLRQGRSTLGAFGSLVLRERSGARSLLLHDAAMAGGVDFRHRFFGDRYQLWGYLMGSRVHGSPDALARTQSSPTHFFQRPDAEHLTLAPNRESLTGASGLFRLHRIAGGPWRWGIGFHTRTPGLELNDAGYQRHSDINIGYINLGYEETRPRGPFRTWEVSSTLWTTRTWGGEEYERVGNLKGEATLSSLWRLWGGVEYDMGGLSFLALRGGPLLRREGEIQGWLGISTDDRRALSLGLRGRAGSRPESSSSQLSLEFPIRWRPSSGASLSLSPFLQRVEEDQQWLGRVGESNPRYIFGRLSQPSAGVVLRGDLAFSPTLTLQFYARPYLSGGRYSAFRRVVDPRARDHDQRLEELPWTSLPGGDVLVDLDGDGTPEPHSSPDFGFRELRANVVLRWEFSPGSTFYLVWSQGRSHLSRDGSFELDRDLRTLFQSPSRDALMVKISYWMTR